MCRRGDPNPEDSDLDRQWYEFTIGGQGLTDVSLSTNVRRLNGLTSTGAVEMSSSSILPTVESACERTYSTSYSRQVGDSFSLVGCRAGTVIVTLSDPNDNYRLLATYSITVSSTP